MSALARTVGPDRRTRRTQHVRAFLRRDVLTMVSYRGALVTEWVGLVAQLAIFSLVARMVDPTIVPAYGGQRPGYLAYVTVGLVVGAFMSVGLAQVADAIRQEQMIGTLESLLATRLTPSGLHAGTLAWAAVYAPIRIVVFVGLAVAVFDVEIAVAGLAPAFAVGACLLAAISGLGVIAGSLVLTLRRGSGSIGAVAALSTAVSGAYFPIDLLPGWVQPLVAANPIAVAVEGMRLALLGGAGWADVVPHMLWLVAMAVPSSLAGRAAFRWALRREVRHGRLGHY